jgi:hypothetical protein
VPRPSSNPTGGGCNHLADDRDYVEAIQGWDQELENFRANNSAGRRGCIAASVGSNPYIASKLRSSPARRGPMARAALFCWLDASQLLGRHKVLCGRTCQRLETGLIAFTVQIAAVAAAE